MKFELLKIKHTFYFSYMLLLSNVFQLILKHKFYFFNIFNKTFFYLFKKYNYFINNINFKLNLTNNFVNTFFPKPNIFDLEKFGNSLTDFKSNLTFLFQNNKIKNINEEIKTVNISLNINNKPTSIIFSYENTILKFFLFKLFFLFNHSFSNVSLVGNANFTFYHIVSRGEKIIVFNYRFFFYKWLITWNFLFNLSYYQLSRTLLTAPFYYKHSLAWNWNSNSWAPNLWRYFLYTFFFLTPKYNVKTNFFFLKIKSLNLHYFVVTDFNYHLKNIFYLKKNFYFTISLLGLNENPFLVDYPIFAFFENHLIQLFFLKILLFLEKHSQLLKFTFFKKLWINTNYRYLIQ